LAAADRRDDRYLGAAGDWAIIRDVLGVHGNPKVRQEWGQDREGFGQRRFQVGDRAGLGQLDRDRGAAGTLPGQGEESDVHLHGGTP
jgi:hypothetical protein